MFLSFVLGNSSQIRQTAGTKTLLIQPSSGRAVLAFRAPVLAPPQPTTMTTSKTL